MKRLQRVAWIPILIVDVDTSRGAQGPPYHRIICSAQAARRFCRLGTRATPADRGRSSRARLRSLRGYMTLLFRMYGLYCVLFGLLSSTIAVTAFRRGERWAWWAVLVGNTVALVSAMTYDQTVNAIGPFEVTEYLGLVMVWAALTVTAPFRAAARPAHVSG